MSFYTEMAELASEMLANAEQGGFGVTTAIHRTTSSTHDPLTGTMTPETILDVPIHAVRTEYNKIYTPGALVRDKDTFWVLDTVVLPNDQLIINNVEAYNIVEVWKTNAAGVFISCIVQTRGGPSTEFIAPSVTPTATPPSTPASTVTPTPTVTTTVTPTSTVTPTVTPTQTVTPTMTVTPTPSMPPPNNNLEMVFNMTSTSLTIPCQDLGVFDAVVDWGDETTSDVTSYNDSRLTHVYSSTGEYTVSISGTFPNIYFNNTAGNRNNLTSVQNLGDTGLMSLNNAFFGCANMTSFVAGESNTPLLTNTNYMFRDLITIPYIDVSGMDLSGVTDMANMFYRCKLATTINVSGLDTSSAQTMANMFRDCNSVTELDVSSWDTSLVEDMSAMFRSCTVLDGLDVSGWDTSLVNNMFLMFVSCPALSDLAINRWNIESVANFANFLTGSGLPTVRYDATLISWAAQDPINSLSIDFGSTSEYTTGGAAEAGRTKLVDVDLWSITDGGEAPALPANTVQFVNGEIATFINGDIVEYN